MPNGHTIHGTYGQVVAGPGDWSRVIDYLRAFIAFITVAWRAAAFAFLSCALAARRAAAFAFCFISRSLESEFKLTIINI